MALKDYLAKLRKKPIKQRAEERIAILRGETAASNMAEDHVAEVLGKFQKDILAPGGGDIAKAYLDTIRSELAHRLRVARSKRPSGGAA